MVNFLHLRKRDKQVDFNLLSLIGRFDLKSKKLPPKCEIAQRVERNTDNVDGAGSSPVFATKIYKTVVTELIKSVPGKSLKFGQVKD